MENPPLCNFGKLSISMGHLYLGYVSHNQRVHMGDFHGCSVKLQLLLLVYLFVKIAMV